jgi:hypothetical protein
MRTKWLAASLMLVAGFGVGPLFAASGAVTVSPVAISAPLQAALHKQYGDAEAAVLQSAVKDRLERSLNSDAASNSGASPKRIEVTIDDAKPSHPTRYQMQENPSIDPLRSRSLGGARLHAVLRGADGKVLDQVDYKDYATSFQEASPSGDAWADARVTIERFSDLVVKSWRRSRREP